MSISAQNSYQATTIQTGSYCFFLYFADANMMGYPIHKLIEKTRHFYQKLLVFSHFYAFWKVSPWPGNRVELVLGEENWGDAPGGRPQGSGGGGDGCRHQAGGASGNGVSILEVYWNDYESKNQELVWNLYLCKKKIVAIFMGLPKASLVFLFYQNI